MLSKKFLSLTTSSVIAMVLLAGCDKLGAYNHWQASGFTPDVATLYYGPDKRQVLDLYLPDTSIQPAPLVIWFYGGSWDSGDRGKYAFVAKRFTELGYAVAIHDYRLVPDVHFPAFVEDGASAIAFMKQYAKQHPEQLKNTPFMLAGHSAGAYNAVQVVADQRYLAAVGLGVGDIAGIIGLSGPYDFYPYDVAATQNAFRDTPATESQPVEMKLNDMPPLLLVTGTRDHTVYPKNSRRLAELAPQAKLIEIPGTGHAGTLIALGFYLTTDDRILTPVKQFLKEHLPAEK